MSAVEVLLKIITLLDYYIMELTSLGKLQYVVGIIVVIIILFAILTALLNIFPLFGLRMSYRILAWLGGLQKKFIDISPSIRISYYERGVRKRGQPTLLMIHGYTLSKDFCLDAVRYLPKNIHVIVIDLPGHGESTYKDKNDLSIMSFVYQVKKFADKLNLPAHDFHMLGFSMGGEIAGMYAVTYPTDLKSLILACPLGIDNPRVRKMEDEFRRTGKFVLLPDTLDDFDRLMKTATYKPGRVPSWIAKGLLQVRRLYRKEDIAIGKSIFISDDPYLLEENISRITTPLFLLWGRHDKILDVSCVAVIRKKLPKPPKKDVVLEGCGHCIFIEKPKESARLIVEYLNSFY